MHRPIAAGQPCVNVDCMALLMGNGKFDPLGLHKSIFLPKFFPQVTYHCDSYDSAKCDCKWAPLQRGEI